MLALTGVLALTFAPLAFAADPGTDGKSDQAALVQGNSEFAFDLYRKLRSDDNLFFSPWSISTALGMTSAGARGATQEEMAKTLHFTLPGPRLHSAMGALVKDFAGAKTKDYQLRVANALWGQQGLAFQPDFLQLTREAYGAELRPVDFKKETEQARQTINDWVEKQTEGKIKELLRSGVLTVDTRLVLTNAIYFKSTWLQPFNEKATTPGDWKLTADKKVPGVPLMQQSVNEAHYYENADLQMVALPYQGEALSMIVLLPKKADGLGKIEESLGAARLDEWLKAAALHKVDLTLPRFKLTAEADLKKTLTEMGMGQAFSQGADFSGISTSEPLMLSAVVHKAVVEVDEKGTEAAAATGVVVGAKKLAEHQPVVFRADHPFIFLIRDNQTKSILFLGRLNNPAS
jgi:serpin B